VAAFGSHLDWLFARFTATIPLKRAVKVTYSHHIRDEAMVAIGLPRHNKPWMLYVEDASGGLVAIPKALVRNIEGATPAMPDVLTPDNAKFALFRMVWLPRQMRVRISYLTAVPDDPALPLHMRNRGMPCTTEGMPLAITDETVTIAIPVTVSVGSENNSTPIPPACIVINRKQVLDMIPLGPSTVPSDHPAIQNDKVN
jgi:hypothetical protein